MTKPKGGKATEPAPKKPKPKAVRHAIHDRDSEFLALFLAHWIESSEKALTKARIFKERAPDLPSADANIQHWSSVLAGLKWVLSHRYSDLNFDPPPFPGRTNYGTADVGV